MARGKQKPKGKGSKGYNRKATEDFLTKNKLKPGVRTTDSGLQYIVIDESEGPASGAGHTVIVHQRISLLDGTLIDDTYKQNDPAVFKMEEAVEGYREGLMMMAEGARYKFFIPPELAWGKRGAGNKIGPNALLVIDAKLVGFCRGIAE